MFNQETLKTVTSLSELTGVSSLIVLGVVGLFWFCKNIRLNGFFEFIEKRKLYNYKNLNDFLQNSELDDETRKILHQAVSEEIFFLSYGFRVNHYIRKDIVRLSDEKGIALHHFKQALPYLHKCGKELKIRLDRWDRLELKLYQVLAFSFPVVFIPSGIILMSVKDIVSGLGIFASGLTVFFVLIKLIQPIQSAILIQEALLKTESD